MQPLVGCIQRAALMTICKPGNLAVLKILGKARVELSACRKCFETGQV
jgi:hypothetical protein